MTIPEVVGHRRIPQRKAGWATSRGMRFTALVATVLILTSSASALGNDAPVAALTAPSTGTLGSPVAFNASGSYDPDGTIVSYGWCWYAHNEVDETTSSPTIGKVFDGFEVPGNRSAGVLVTDNQGATDYMYVYIYMYNDFPTAVISAPAAASPGQFVPFSASGSTDSGEIVEYAWDFGDGDTGNGVSVSHTYASAGSYEVMLTTTDNWGEHTHETHDISIANAPPTAAIAGPSTASPGQLVSFSGSASSDSDGTITSYAWTFGDGGSGSGASIGHTYDSEGTYTISLTVTDNEGATDATSTTIAISNVDPVAAFTAPSSGSTGETIFFNGGASSDADGSITSYSWSFGDGGTGSGVSVTHSYSSPGTYTVMLTVTDDGGDTDQTTRSIQITQPPAPVNQAPTARFSYTPAEPEAGTEIRFSATSSRDSDGRITSYAWKFGDGATAYGTSATHAFTHAGRYKVDLTVTDDEGATDSDSEWIDIQPANVPPVPQFSVVTSPIVAGSPVGLDPTASTDADGHIVWYGWDWNDDGAVDLSIAEAEQDRDTVLAWDEDMDGAYDRFTEELETAKHVFSLPGTYRVTLTVRDDQGAEAQVSQAIAVGASNLPPTASFTRHVLSADGARLVVEPRRRDLVEFDASESSDPDGGIVEYAWDWDADGTIDETTSDPVIEHTFSAAGDMPVTLRVTDDGGASDETSGVVRISERAGPAAAFSFAPDAPSMLDEVTFNDASTHPEGEIISWEWAFGDEITSEERNPLHRYETKGPFEVSLRVTDSEGESASAQHELVIVNLPPETSFAITPDRPVIDEPVKLDASSSTDPDGKIAAWAWDVDGDGEADASDPVVDWTFDEAGTHPIALTVTDEDGATSTRQQLITVEEPVQIVEPREVWALVIGISEYEEVRDLEFARADGESFAQWLFEADVPDDHVQVLYDGEATMTKVRAALGWLRRMAHPDDLVFVFFAGHGYQGADDDGDEQDGVDEFLVLADTVTGAVDDTALRDDEFGRFLDRVESEHVMVVFDSCHSGGQSRSLSSGTRPLGDTFDLFNDFSLDGKLVFAAASEDQKALEDPDLGHGIFTHFLIEGLRGTGDLDQDFKITADELHRYVGEEVERYAREQLGQDQTPEMRGRGQVGIVLAAADQPPQPGFEVHPDTPYAWGATQFLDTSEDDDVIVAWEWSFGDGATAAEQNPTHVYEKPGAYKIALTVTDNNGASSSVEQAILIAPPGEVTVVDGETVVISLGSEHGISLRDRFDVVRVFDLAGGGLMTEHKAAIEVMQVLDTDRSACRIVEQVFLPAIRDQVRAE